MKKQKRGKKNTRRNRRRKKRVRQQNILKNVIKKSFDASILLIIFGVSITFLLPLAIFYALIAIGLSALFKMYSIKFVPLHTVGYLKSKSHTNLMSVSNSYNGLLGDDS